MGTEAFEEPDQLLDRATAALRAHPVPAVPDALVARTLGRLESQTPEAMSIPQRGILLKMLPRFSVAAVIVLAIGVAIWSFTSQGSNLALAQVVAAVKQVRAASFKMVITMTPPVEGQGKISIKTMTFTSDTLIVEPAWMRSTTKVMGMEVVQVINYQQRKILMLMPAFKTATLMEMTNLSQDQREELDRMNLLEQMKKIDPKLSAQDLGEKEFDGRLAHGFHVSQGPMDTVIWADVQTKLPVHMDITTQKTPLMGQMVVKATDFSWNLEVDPSLMSFDMPKDYTLTSMAMNMAPPSESDLIASLRELAQLGGGKFPSSFDTMGMGEQVAKNMTPERAMEKAMMKQLTEQMNRLTRGIMFIADPKQVMDWHYAGRGMKLGQPDTPIGWYEPKGAKMYRLIDANLGVRDIPKKEADKLTTHLAQMSLAAPAQADETEPVVRSDVSKEYALMLMKLKMAMPSESDLIASLRELAQLGGGKFPPKFDIMAVARWASKGMAFPRHLHRKPGNFSNPTDAFNSLTPHEKAMINQLSERITRMNRGIWFTTDPMQVTDWHYAGKGVKLGQDTPIGWYRPKGATMYRVINAKLEVRDISKVEADKLTARAAHPRPAAARQVEETSTRPGGSETQPSPN